MYKLTTEDERQLHVECHSSGDPPPRIVWYDLNIGDIVAESSVMPWQRGPRAPLYPAVLKIDANFVAKRQHYSRLNLTCLAENAQGRATAHLEVALRGYLGEVARRQKPRTGALIGGNGSTSALQSTIVAVLLTLGLALSC